VKSAEEKDKQGRALILARMAATRAELVAGGHVSRHVLGSRQPQASASIDAGPIFLQSPYAQLLAAFLVVSTILGPRHTAVTALRAALIPWMTRTIRATLR
jgi:hypothetical protein